MRRTTGVLLCGLVGAAAACGDAGPTAPPVPTDTLLLLPVRNVLLEVGQTRQLAAVVLTERGDTLPTAVAWTAGNPAVATVTAGGLLTAVAPGATHVRASALGLLDSVAVTVTATPIARPGLELVTGALSEPVFLTTPPGDAARLFVVEKGGQVRIIRNGVLVPRPFLDIRSLVSRGGEQGLLSIAFHPQYARNGYVYTSYTNVQGHTRVVRYQVAGTDPDSLDPATAFTILAVDQPFPNHNGGLVLFGPDGKLYVGLGDGGSAGDPQGNGQNLGTLLGKLLRLDVDAGTPYAVPPDNPFVGTPGARGEIWARGLRNPWRFSFDRATGTLYLGDVGQDAREEIDVEPAGGPGGLNWGWNVMEGRACFVPGCSSAGLALPVLDYTHQEGCTVVGGYVYRGSALPILQGHYLYADYCAGWVRSFTYAAGQASDLTDWTSELGPGTQITSFGEDDAGELYVMTQRGRLYRIAP